MIIDQAIDGRNEDGLNSDINITGLYNIKFLEK